MKKKIILGIAFVVLSLVSCNKKPNRNKNTAVASVPANTEQETSKEDTVSTDDNLPCDTVKYVDRNIKDGSVWTDGRYLFTAKTFQSGASFSGINQFEGGYFFDTDHVKGKTYALSDNTDLEFIRTMLGPYSKAGCKVVVEKVGGYKLLCCYDSKDHQIAMLRCMGDRDEESLDEEVLVVLDQVVREVYAGEYVDKKTGKKWSFTTDGKYSVAGGAINKKYKLMRGPEAIGYGWEPDLVRLADGSVYMVHKTSDGFTFKKLKHPKIQGDCCLDITESKEEIRLQCVSKAYAKWPYSSTKLLEPYALVEFDKETLRLMRCEIYARHGGTFDDKTVQSHFDHKSWYVKKMDHKKVKLSELEKKNIQTIEMVEAWLKGTKKKDLEPLFYSD